MKFSSRKKSTVLNTFTFYKSLFIVFIYLFGANAFAQGTSYDAEFFKDFNNKDLMQFSSDLEIGVIGKTDSNSYDNPTDNIFVININTPINDCSRVFLTYKVFGVDGKNAVSKSINERYATGGYLVKKNDNWVTYQEELDKSWLKQGANQITFRIPDQANYFYKIKDLSIIVEKNKLTDCYKTDIVNTDVDLELNHQVYIKGFIRNYKDTAYEVFCNNQKMILYDNEYEGFVTIDNTDVKYVNIELKQGNTVIENKKILLNNLKTADFQFDIVKPQTKFSQLFFKDKGGSFVIDGAAIKIPDSALTVNKKIYISKLRSIDIAPLPQGMVNVTKDGGYRFLPDGTKFNKAIELSLAYDKSKIPNGYSEKDIVTYYFDTKTKKWTAIKKESIDKKKQLLTSYTTHFTDYINGIIKTPESPQTNSFAPTVMSGIKAGNPTAGMNIIQPPKASQTGDAGLSYPIQIPSGRNGMQPNIGIQYSSSGGNGWLGLGWSISMPSISVDSRWGVPIFDSDKESEMYTFNGEQLMYPKVQYQGNYEDYMPNRYRGDLSNFSTELQARNYAASSGIMRFGLRKHNPTTKIERFGDSPDNYYWKVTNADGVVSWYGGDENGINENAVIRQASGNIVHWGLRKTIDTYGNNVIYEYENYNLSVPSGDPNENLDGGKIFNIKNIYYTGTDNDLGKYKIEFFNETQINRKYLSTNFRRGLKEISPYRLDKIEVSYNGELIRKYQLSYRNGVFNKSLLDKITALDPDDHVFNEHQFDYYDDLQNPNELYDFSSPITIDANANDFEPDYMIGFDAIAHPSVLSSDENREGGFSVRAAVGVEFLNPSFSPNRHVMVGTTTGINWVKGQGMILLIDIDGDGLDDLVFRRDDGLYYKKHVIDGTDHIFLDRVLIMGASYFQKSEGKTIMPVFSSIDVATSLTGGLLDSYLYSRSSSRSFMETNIYLTDANKDGLIDVVKPSSTGKEVVYFNHLDADGVPNFDTDSSLSPNMVMTDSNQPPIPDVQDPLEEDEEAIQEAFSFDMVKVWIAPKDGQIIIDDAVSLADTPDSGESITYSIETTRPGTDINNDHNIYRLYLLADYNSTTPTIVHLNNYQPGLGCQSCSGSLTVREGQRIFFRIRGNNGVGENAVITNPHIRYTDEPVSSQINNFNSNYHDAYLLSSEGKIRVTRQICERIDYQLKWKPFVVNEQADVIYEMHIEDINRTYTLRCPAGSNTTMSVENFFGTNNIPIISIYRTTLTFKVYTDGDRSLINWENVQWRPSLVPAPSPRPSSGPVPKFYPIPHYDNFVFDFLLLHDDDGNLVYDNDGNEINTLPHLGPLNRGWGQFAYNDAEDKAPDALPADQYGRLIRISRVIRPNDVSVGFIDENELEDIDEDHVENYVDSFQDDNIDFESMMNDLTTVGFPFKILKPYRNCDNCADFVCDDTGSAQTSYVEKWYGLNLDQYISAGLTDPGVFDTTNGNSPSVDAGLPEVQEPEENMQTQPESESFGMSAISKFTESRSVSTVKGVGFLKQVDGHSDFSFNLSDFIDLNGDGYPDIIVNDPDSQTSTVLLTSPVGNHIRTLNADLLTESESWSTDWMVGTTQTVAISTGRKTAGGTTSQDDKSGTTKTDNQSNGDNTNPAIHLNFGGGISFKNGENTPSVFFQDVNSDGLPDKIECNNCGNDYRNRAHTYRIYYNDGSFNFNNDESSNFKGPNSSGKKVYNLSLSGNPFGSGGFSVGLSAGGSISTAETKIFHTDVNGDGLMDFIQFDGSRYYVYFNLGNTFTSGINFTLDDINHSTTTSASMSASVSAFGSVPFGFIFPIFFKFGATGSANYNLSISDQNISFKDFNGDGYVDILISSGQNEFKVYLNKTGRTNMLKQVNNYIGGSFVLDYDVISPTYKNPNSKWVLSKVSINDGYDFANDGEDIYVKQIKYGNAYYDRRERSFYGFDKVSTQDIKEVSGSSPEVYRTYISEYYNTSYFNNGLLKKSYMIKGEESNITRPEIYSITENNYMIKTIDEDWKIDLHSNPSLDDFDTGGTEGRKQAIVLLQSTKNSMFSFSRRSIVSTTGLKYDSYGRVVRYNYEDSNHTYESFIKYHSNAALEQNNLLNIPEQIAVYSHRDLLRKRETFDIDYQTGSIGGIRTYYTSRDFVETGMKYDDFGNLALIVYPENESGQRMSYAYTYDNDLHKYVVSVKDAFGYVSESQYDPKFDAITGAIDIAGNKMAYTYDSFGRVKTITGPKELHSNAPFTIAFDYYRNPSELPNFSAPVAITKHFDPQHPNNFMETYSFTDGLARPIQVKKDIEMGRGEAMSVSGLATYDAFGRVVEQFNPGYEAKNPSTNLSINPSTSSYSTKTELDEADRAVEIADPLDNRTYIKYRINNDGFNRLSLETKTIIEQNDHQEIVSYVYKDIQGKQTSTKKVGPDGDVWTKFRYNGIGELMAFIDDENIETDYKYDIMGRKLAVSSPDYGTTSFQYDNAGNLIAQQTANLARNNQWVHFKYDYNRIEAIRFPEIQGHQNISNVIYKYGDTGNNKGRVIVQEDATGSQEFEYGNMGEIRLIKRQVVTPVDVHTFVTKFDYDTWNRIQEIIYPDGEKVTYDYNLGGKVKSIVGLVNGDRFPYLENVVYSYDEQPEKIAYGNGVVNTYHYTEALRRMKNLNIMSRRDTYLDNTYRYDKVGNITRISNRAGVTNNMLGNYNNTYVYDVLNRLSGAEGGFEGDRDVPSGDSDSRYSLSMKYNNTYGIVQKKQEHYKNDHSFLPNTYQNDYTYYGGTHRLKEIVDQNTHHTQNFEYDDNGNLKIKISNNDERRLYWDESNRLRVVEMDHNMQHYIYDAAGERVLKANTAVESIYENGQLTGQSVNIDSYTMYPSGYLVYTNDGRYTKHYYMGTTRIATQVGDGHIRTRAQAGEDVQKLQNLQKADLADILRQSKNFKKVTYNKREPVAFADDEEKDTDTLRRPSGNVYFYHPDHLGTATLLTDISGDPYQFFLNLPFGEEMATQHSTLSNFSSRYKFNGKELDRETGWYYYGARYYDPQVSTWLSVDPLAEKYIGFSPYNFTLGNPVRIIDPEGKDTLNVVRRNNKWVFTKYQKAKGDDVINVQVGALNYSYTYSDGEYGNRVIMLTLPEDTEDNFGIFLVSGAKTEESAYGYFTSPGGNRSNSVDSGKTIVPGTYSIIPGTDAQSWQTLWIVGNGGNDYDVRGRHIKIHNIGYANGEYGNRWGYAAFGSRPWSTGCFVVSSDYRIASNKHIQYKYGHSIATLSLALFNMGGNVGTKRVGKNHEKIKATFNKPIRYSLFFSDSNIH